MLEQAEQRNPDRGRVVFYLGDGEQTATEPAAPFTIDPRLINGGAVLGYGTSEGGRMKATRSRFDATTDYIIDPATGEDARSVIDEDALRGIGKQLGLPYLHRESGDGVATIVATRRPPALRHERRGRGPTGPRPAGALLAAPHRCRRARGVGARSRSDRTVADPSSQGGPAVSTPPRPHPGTPPPHDREPRGVATLLDDPRPGRHVRWIGGRPRHGIPAGPGGDGTTARRRDRGPP